MNIHNINTIARYEVKLLQRSWLFRIFAILVLLILTLMQLGNLSFVFWKYSETWGHTGLSSLVPFFTVYFYSVAQSVIVIFLAGSFLKRDKKLDTAEVIYVRPMSNADYIVGKVWGIVRVFLGLNLITFAVAMFITLVLNRSPFSLYPYLLYLFTISLPSLLFVLGLSFTAMCLLKNQAVTFIVMLGIIGTIFFYLPEKWYGIFDFFGVNIPSVLSDVTGHADMKLFLWQRLIYLLLGAGFICLTITLVKRLPHRPWKTKLLALGSVVIIAAAVAVGWAYWLRFETLAGERAVIAERFNAYAEHPKVNVISHALRIAQDGGRLSGRSELQVRNNRPDEIKELIFYLNPDLDVSEVKAGGEEVPYKREKQVLIVEKPLESGAELTLTIAYEGGIDENSCYTDIEDKDFFANPVANTFKYRYGKRYAYLSDDYTLLTPETMWYPVAEAPVYPAAPYKIKRDFTRYALVVKARPGKTVISQGSMEERDGELVFTNEVPLPGISLTIGEYEKKSIRVDSTDYEIYNFPGHDFYSKYFPDLQDTLPNIIRDIRNTTEVAKNRAYPFAKFCMVETPVHFTGYIRNWKGYTEQVMPEIVFVAERALLTSSDFRSQHLRMKDWKRRDEVVEERDIQINMLRDFVQNAFIKESSSDGDMRWSQSPEVNKMNMAAMFFTFTGFIHSAEYPVIDVALNILQNMTEAPRQMWWFGGDALTDKQRANIYLQTKSFEEAIADRGIKPQIFYEMLKLKSSFLKYHIVSEVPAKELDAFLKEFRDRHNFKIVSFDEFAASFSKRFNIDIQQFIRKWYRVNHSPAIELMDVDANKVVLEDYTKYQIRFKAYNSSDLEAIISAKVEEGGNRWGGFRPGGGNANREDNTQYYVVPPRSAREIKIINDERPARLIINTNISQNLPNEFTYNFSKVDNEISDTTRGVFPVDTLLFAKTADEIIVDNEDAGFRIIEPEKKRKLKDYFRKEDEEKYKPFFPWRFPSQWTAVLNSTCYGLPVHSAVHKRKGTGVHRVEWTATLPENSVYEVFIWNPKFESWFWRRERHRSEQNQTYTIRYDMEEESATVDLSQGESGWMSLGTFYLPKGEVTVSLSDKVSGQFVVADAVRFSRVKN